MMKNKKLKLIIAVTLILQLILPLYLLTYHYSAYDEALKTADFKFPLEYLDIYNIHDTGDSVQQLGFSIRDIYEYYGEDIEVTVGDDGFAQMASSKNKSLNKHWFTFKYYYSSNYYTSEEYEYAPGVNKTDIIYRINALRMEDVPNLDGFYMTAKAYKGIFIPTAIYYEGEKIIIFHIES